MSIQLYLTSAEPVHDETSDVSCNSYLSSFREVTSNDLSMLIAPLASKSCDLDPIHGIVMQECLDSAGYRMLQPEYSPFLTNPKILLQFCVAYIGYPLSKEFNIRFYFLPSKYSISGLWV